LLLAAAVGTGIGTEEKAGAEAPRLRARRWAVRVEAGMAAVGVEAPVKDAEGERAAGATAYSDAERARPWRARREGGAGRGAETRAGEEEGEERVERRSVPADCARKKSGPPSPL